MTMQEFRTQWQLEDLAYSPNGLLGTPSVSRPNYYSKRETYVSSYDGYCRYIRELRAKQGGGFASYKAFMAWCKKSLASEAKRAAKGAPVWSVAHAVAAELSAKPVEPKPAPPAPKFKAKPEAAKAEHWVDVDLEAAAYCNRLRHPAKKAYAASYWVSLKSGQDFGPDTPHGLSFMAAQGVRMTLDSLFSRYLHAGAVVVREAAPEGPKPIPPSKPAKRIPVRTITVRARGNSRSVLVRDVLEETDGAWIVAPQFEGCQEYPLSKADWQLVA